MPNTLRSSLLKTDTLYAHGISATDIPAQNLRGRVTVSGAMRFGAIKAMGTARVTEPEPEAQYFVTATSVATRGEVPPAAMSLFRVSLRI